VLKLNGVPPLLFDEEEGVTDTISQSELVSAVLNSAYTYQREASETRFGVVPRTTEGQSGLGGRFKILSKAAAVRAERKAKKVEADIKDRNIGVKITATVWMTSGGTHNKRLQEVGSGQHHCMLHR